MCIPIKKEIKDTDSFNAATDFLGITKDANENKVHNPMIDGAKQGQSALGHYIDMVEYAYGNNEPSMDPQKVEKATFKPAGTDTDIGSLDNKMNIAVGLNFYTAMMFSYNVYTDSYDYTNWSLLLSAFVNFEYITYRIFAGIPVYFDMGLYLQFDFTHYHNLDPYVPSEDEKQELVRKASESGITLDDFENYSGNLMNFIPYQGDGENSEIYDIVARGTFMIGAGIKGIVGVSGAIIVGMKFTENGALRHQGKEDIGVILNFSGSIGVDLFFMKVTLPIATPQIGFGMYEGQTGVSWVGASSDIIANASQNKFGSGDSNDREDGEMKLEYLDNGSADMSSFGGSDKILFGGQPTTVGYKVIKDNAAERAKPKLVRLDDNRLFLTFLGNNGSGDSDNSSGLYYAIRETNGTWSTPKLVEGTKKTNDYNANIVKIGGKIYVSWVKAYENISKSEDFHERWGKHNIALKVYDIATDTWSHTEYLTKNENLPSGVHLLNVNPRIASIADKLYVTYLQMDVSSLSKEEQVFDIYGNYTAYKRTDVDINNIASHSEIFIPTVVGTASIIEQDPKVYDFQYLHETIGGDEYVLAAQLADVSNYDPNKEDAKGKNVYIRIARVDGSELKGYFPVRISSIDCGSNSLQLKDINGTAYVFWSDSSGKFNVFNFTSFVEDMFYGDAGNVFKDMTTAERNNPAWYKKTKAELPHIPDTDNPGNERDMYELSCYSNYCKDKFDIESRNLIDILGNEIEISEYVPVTDGDEIYILFTKRCDNLMHFGKELYGMKYSEESDYATKSETDSVINGFSDIVQLTDYEKNIQGSVLDEIDAIMDNDGKMTLVSNHYGQTVTKEETKRGINKIVAIEYEPKGSVEIVDGTLQVGGSLNPGDDANVRFKIRNNGLMPAKNIKIDVVQRINGVETTLMSETMNNTYLDVNQAVVCNAHWTVPESEKDIEIIARVNETGVSISNPDDEKLYIKAEPENRLVDLESRYDEKRKEVVVKGTIRRAAPKKTIPKKKKRLKLSVNEGGKEVRYVAEKDIILNSTGNIGDEFELSFVPQEDNFNYYGAISMNVEVYNSENVEETKKVIQFTSLEPLVIEPSHEISEVIAIGDRKNIEPIAYPHRKLLGEPIYYTSDDSVAYVKNGVLYGKSEGTARIGVKYPDMNYYETMDVTVGNKTPHYSGGSSSGGGGGKVLIDETKVNMKVTGTPNTWFYNPRTSKWFRIGQDGYAIKGWYQDEKGIWYYFDSTTAEMCTGLKAIDNKFYYFAEVDGLGKLAGDMYINEMTPIGFMANDKGELIVP